MALDDTAPHDHCLLCTEAIMFAGLAELERAMSDSERVQVVATLIFNAFNDYYTRSRVIPWEAKGAFERRDWQESLALSKERISIYSVCIEKLTPLLRLYCPDVEEKPAIWDGIVAHFLGLIEGSYQADLAFAFINSVRRMLYRGQWQGVAYSYGEAASKKVAPVPNIFLEFPINDTIAPQTIEAILAIPDFAATFSDREGDAELAAAQINEELGLQLPPSERSDPRPAVVQMLNAGFYRNRSAYLVGRILFDDGSQRPLALALLNEGKGILVDAVVLEGDDLQSVFSSTLANFHVTNQYYHELVDVLSGMMPKQPSGLYYSTLGYNHVGKIAVMQQLKAALAESGDLLDRAIGFCGPVTIGLSAPSLRYILKVIRDKPLAACKCGTFAGVGAVLEKHKRVHQINRVGSMLDSIIYYNVLLPQEIFAAGLLEELLVDSSDTVALQGNQILFKHLILQIKLVPLPIFLETATSRQAERAVINLGHCIKHNATANIFNKALDGRDYGVSPILKVYLHDYNSVEALTDIKVRTKAGRFDKEEEMPGRLFEGDVIFQPEELERHLPLNDRQLRHLFRTHHGDLFELEYWQSLQERLHEGRIPRTTVYRDTCRLDRD